jgi:predicted P-loop ATPase
MSELKPLIICEPGAVDVATKVALGYAIQVIPRGAGFDPSDFTGRRVILWPDASEESRTSFRLFAEKINDLCTELKIITPNGRPHGWNITAAVSRDGMTWADLASWAKVNMMTFAKGEFPAIPVVVTEAPAPLPDSVHDLWVQLGLSMASRDHPALNVDNVVRVLSGWAPFQSMVWFDEFYQRYFTTWNSTTPREWKDIDDINLTVVLQRDFGLLKITSDMVSAGIRCRGHQCKRNEPRDWLQRLHWDGIDRIDRFFSQYFGTVFSGYTAAVSRNFWIGMVARVYQPGCQLDNMVILEGKQGIFKSKALEAIGGKWYMEAAEEITSKDFFVALAGKLIVEIADLDSFSRADTNKIKKVITCRVDRYRQPYGRATQDHPRQSIFVGTTNEQHYLRDNTGARRFWPLTCGRIDLDAIKRDRDQLFAEAVTRYIAREDWYLVPVDATLEEQESRRQYDEWENIIQEYMVGKSELTLTDLAAFIGLDKSKIDLQVQRRMGAVLRRYGWTSKVTRRGLSLLRVWFPLELSVNQGQPLEPVEPSHATV